MSTATVQLRKHIIAQHYWTVAFENRSKPRLRQRKTSLWF